MVSVFNERPQWCMAEESLGQRVRALRLARGMTQAQLAHLAGVQTQAVNLIEKGRRERPEMGTLEGLAHALETTPAFLEYGVWNGDHDIPPELVVTYASLNDIQRRAFVDIGRRLRDVQSEYAALHSTPDVEEPEEEERRVAFKDATGEGEAEYRDATSAPDQEETGEDEPD